MLTPWALQSDMRKRIDAAELGGPGWYVGLWAGFHVRVSDYSTGQLATKTAEPGRGWASPPCEIGGGCLDRKDQQIRLRKTVTVAPPAGSNAHLRDGSLVGCSRRPDEGIASHEHSVASLAFQGA